MRYNGAISIFLNNNNWNFFVNQSRFSFLIAGDSGDGIQLVGQSYSASLAHAGQSVKTVSFFPAEIRAPAGTCHGVSGMQVCFSTEQIWAPPAKVEYLIALNPAAYWVSKDKLHSSGKLICDSSMWEDKHWKKAGLDHLNLESLPHRALKVPLSDITLKACENHSLNFAQAKKNRNFTALGLVLWLSGLDLEHAFSWLDDKFAHKKDLLEAAKSCMQSGFNLGDTLEIGKLSSTLIHSDKKETAKNSTSKRKNCLLVTGNQAITLGCVATAHQCGQTVGVYGYPITPASDILEYSSKFPKALVVEQAEDEMGALGMALGAAWGGRLTLTCTSGPGFDLKTELIGLGQSAEIPTVIVNVQRAGPSTGMPTKVEQSDVLAALWGRHGDCPIPVLAPYSAENCFEITQRAFHWAKAAQCPVIVLSDLALAQSAGQLDPDQVDLSPMDLPQPQDSVNPDHILKRNDSYVKPWVVPGMKNGQSTIGGLEKDQYTSLISYDGENHQQMVEVRAKKVQALARVCPNAPQPSLNKRLIISFGSSAMVVKQFLVDHSNIEVDLWIMTDLLPLPLNFHDVLSRFDEVIVIEMNHGQLIHYLKTQTRKSTLKWHSWLWQKSALFNDKWLMQCFNELKCQEVNCG